MAKPQIPQVFVACKLCSKMVRELPSLKRIYCSKACQNIAQKTRFIGSGNPNCKHRPPKVCIDCGTRITKNAKKRCRPCKAKAATGEGNPFYGEKHTTKSRKLISKAHKGRVSTFLGRHHTEENKKQSSEFHKERWKTLSKKKRRAALDCLQRGCETQLKHKNPTRPEKCIMELMESVGMRFSRNEPLYGKFFVDFAITDTNILIEVFGDYWHCNRKIFSEPRASQIKQEGRDRSRLAYLRKCGHKVIVFWEQDIKSKSSKITRILQKVRKVQEKTSYAP
jgi:G:T-mismatch repair DNA endonuclease (very short patch repair protein)